MQFSSGLDTNLAAAQLRLLFDVRAVFDRRGRMVTALEPKDRLLFDVESLNDEGADIYSFLSSHSARRILALVANSSKPVPADEIHRELSEAISSEKINSYLEEACGRQLLLNTNGTFSTARPGVGFGATLEWCVAFTFAKQMSCPAFWGVQVKGLSGDYDVIVHRETQIGYVECKSGRLGNISKTAMHEFLEREKALAPAFSIFLADEVSLDRLKVIADFMLEHRESYLYEGPGCRQEVAVQLEEYKRFLRVTGINCFLVSPEPSLKSVFSEVFHFLTTVCDRPMPFENTVSKTDFQ